MRQKEYPVKIVLRRRTMQKNGMHYLLRGCKADVQKASALLRTAGSICNTIMITITGLLGFHKFQSKLFRIFQILNRDIFG